MQEVSKMSKTENILLEYQKTIPKSLRIITNISHTSFFKELEYYDLNGELTIESIMNIFKRNLWRFPIPNIFFKDTKYEIVFRNHTASDKYFMNWHYDNKQLIKHKLSNLQKIHSLQIVNMDDKYIYGLYCKNPIHFTIIIYLDTYNIDFEGGEFHFHDQIVYPEKGMLLYFDANDLHKVAPLTGGKRRAIIVKIF
jgi:2OG-Fe(II) oxygenase superfamily